MFGQYVNDELQFFPHEEGRIRRRPPTDEEETSGILDGFEYDYFLKDHLGNVRMVLTEEERTDMYPAATMEDATVSEEQALYFNWDQARIDIGSISSNYPTDTYTDPNDYVAQVEAENNPVGPYNDIR